MNVKRSELASVGCGMLYINLIRTSTIFPRSYTRVLYFVYFVASALRMHTLFVPSVNTRTPRPPPPVLFNI